MAKLRDNSDGNSSWVPSARLAYFPKYCYLPRVDNLLPTKHVLTVFFFAANGWPCVKWTPVTFAHAAPTTCYRTHEFFTLPTNTLSCMIEIYRDIFLTLNIAHTYSLCSVLKNTGQCMYVIT
jgi:hypothetical protein